MEVLGGQKHCNASDPRTKLEPFKIRFLEKLAWVIIGDGLSSEHGLTMVNNDCRL